MAKVKNDIPHPRGERLRSILLDDLWVGVVVVMAVVVTC